MTLPIRTWRLVAIAVLLLGAQCYALAHELEHVHDGASEQCTPCALGGGLKHLATAAEFVVTETRCDTSAMTPWAVTIVHGDVMAAEARAPPIHS